MHPPARPVSSAVIAAVVAIGIGACGSSSTSQTPAPASSGLYPDTASSCGFSSTLLKKPERAITMNQGATEVALALGVQGQLVGTAFLDDKVPVKWQSQYDSVPAMAKEYPSREAVIAADPDFVYASYSSAFDPKVAGTQSELAGAGIASYLSPFGCTNTADRPSVTFDSIWSEITAAAGAFGVPDHGTAIEREQQSKVATLQNTAAGKGQTVFWYDSGTKKPSVGAGQGSPQLVIDTVGATNIFASLNGGWTDASWEQVISANPSVIVISDASWSPATDKIAYLEKDSAVSQLTAVKQKRYVTVPFSESTAGVRLVDGASSVSEQLQRLR